MSIETDYAVLRHVLLNHCPRGWAVEFGVYSGYSLNIIAEHSPVIGFDSFQGLPEDWREGFPKGTFATGYGLEENVGLVGINRMIVPGWFEDTTPTFPFPDLGLVHIDCDLYSSTVTALDAVLPHVGIGTIFVFDEFHGYPGWEQHEAKAWTEFIERNLLTVERIAYGDQEAAFILHDIGAP